MTLSLSGEWRGIFSYPHSFPPTGFDAVIDDRDGMLSGTISEPDLWSAATLASAIEGKREGRAVRFGKLYARADDGYDMVAYAGSLSDDGDEISGRWDIPGEWSGSFIMIRRSAPPVEEAIQRAETVDRRA